MAQVALFSVAVALSCCSESPGITVGNLFGVFGSGFGHVAPNDRANSKNTKFRVGGRRGRFKAMLAQWRLCLAIRDRIYTVVTVNTVDRAAMRAEQGITTLTKKRHLFWLVSGI